MRRAAGLRGLVPVLPRPVWAVLAADGLSAAGSGLTLPFLMVYFHSVRHLGLGVAGAAVSVVALAGLVGNPLGGAWSDRIGPRAVLAVGWAVAGVGAGAIAAVDNTWEAFAAAAVSGFGAALAWPALDVLLARLAPADQRSSVFALRHATLNTGLAVGALAASLIVAQARSSHFVVLYLADAASFAAAIVLLQFASRAAESGAAPATDADGAAQAESAAAGESASGSASGPRGYRAVLADGTFRRLWLLIAILVGAGFAQFNASFPVLAIGAGAGAWVVALAFAANTVTVTVCQLPVLRGAAGRRRTSAVAVLCVLWMVAWGLVALGGRSGIGAGPLAALFIAAAVLLALGETLFSPSLPPLINDIAPEELRGRYNGASAFAYTIGFAVGPVAAGLLLSHHERPLLLGILIVVLGVAAGLALDTRRRLPEGTDAIDGPSGASESVPAAEPATTEAAL